MKSKELIKREKLVQKINDALEGTLSELQDGLDILTGDVTPGQQVEWDGHVEQLAELMLTIVEQNKGA